jgi:hypothetical protein
MEHTDAHTDTPFIPAVSFHEDTPSIPPENADGNSHGDRPIINHIDIHADTPLLPAIGHQDIHVDIEAIATQTHLDIAPFFADVSHFDNGFHTDMTPILHVDESNFHIDASDSHTDIPHCDNHGDGLQSRINGLHGDVHYDAVDHTDGAAHSDCTALFNSKQNFHGDIPRISFHADSLFNADESFETNFNEEDR